MNRFLFLRFQAFWLLACLVFLTSCGKGGLDQEEQDALNDSQIQQYVTSHNLAVQKTTSGLYYLINRLGSGTRTVKIGEQLTYAYVLSRLDDHVLDSTSVSQPQQLPWGAGLDIPGLEEGLALLHEGDKAIFLIPSKLAFGGTSYNDLPAYSVIRYDVTLLRIRNETEQIDEYVAAKQDSLGTGETTASGLRYFRLSAGTGAAPISGQSVTVKYTGRFLNGTTFDAGSLPFTLSTQPLQVVPGFDEAVLKMKVGEKATVIFPSSLGYGSRGYPQGNQYAILPYTPLRFDLELISVK